MAKQAFDAIASSSDELLTAALQDLEADTPLPSASSKHHHHLHFEHNLALFLWAEGPSDLPPDAAWVSVAHRPQPASGGLALKAQAVSPSVQHFCTALDAQLRLQLDDLQAYLPTEQPSEPPVATPRPVGAFDRHADADTVQELLRARCGACIGHLADRVGTELQRIQDTVQGQPNALRGGPLHAALFLARLCRSLGELCPHLKQSILGKAGPAEPPGREPRAAPWKQSKGKATAEPSPAEAQWRDLRARLQQQSELGFRVWSTALVDVSAAVVACARAPPWSSLWGGGFFYFTLTLLGGWVGLSCCCFNRN